ncbi:hypothetical protein ECTOBSL9_1532 [Ectothiorhodospira sp. BSL-9]|nr:hypothetical protein ECTOBSL9_1532 [Ectothiorhodospira sp. BSL-9]
MRGEGIRALNSPRKSLLWQIQARAGILAQALIGVHQHQGMIPGQQQARGKLRGAGHVFMDHFVAKLPCFQPLRRAAQHPKSLSSIQHLNLAAWGFRQCPQPTRQQLVGDGVLHSGESRYKGLEPLSHVRSIFQLANPFLGDVFGVKASPTVGQVMSLSRYNLQGVKKTINR